MSTSAERAAVRRNIDLVGSAELLHSGNRLDRETFDRLDLLAGRMST